MLGGVPEGDWLPKEVYGKSISTPTIEYNGILRRSDEGVFPIDCP
jgi:hypothetical protein